MMRQTLPLDMAGRADRPCANSATLSYRQWVEAATQRLKQQWPSADARRLHDIADELFIDPRTGMLDPHQAVEEWLGVLGAQA